MGFLSKLLNERYAKASAGFMRAVCLIIMIFFIICLVLCFLGRLSFTLHTEGQVFDRAIYAESNHTPSIRWFTVSSNDDIHVWANGSGEVNFISYAALCLMYFLNIVPLIFAYWFLGRVFCNVNKGSIFIEQNARFILYFGLLQFFVSLLVPFLKLLICHLSNLMTASEITISTGPDIIDGLIPSIAFIVAAYIIHYGIGLQDEVDHTL